MLNNIFFLPSTTLSIKNNFFLVNFFCYRLTNWFIVNINVFNIYIFEKVIIDYSLKQLYFFLINYNFFIFFLLQVSTLVFIL